ncbi:hypothetical protein [Hymenobacter cellulosilyticus]|uniref:Uncharacterized protein n=1 Tax=Hymenobacter cellulosilyticus TaxID=2932248 RepID=A0A8T9Q019_9BACT|nr:hypothetical protein [Hymenobacter cellulosilyticus]UOQ71106.1 hypothetical protein MUN79_20905 [Hymenobacter cellulosilyticus]
MSQRPTPVPPVAGVSISSKNGIIVLIIILILIALFGKSTTSPGPAAAPKHPTPAAPVDTLATVDSAAE